MLHNACCMRACCTMSAAVGAFLIGEVCGFEVALIFGCDLLRKCTCDANWAICTTCERAQGESATSFAQLSSAEAAPRCTQPVAEQGRTSTSVQSLRSLELCLVVCAVAGGAHAIGEAVWAKGVVKRVRCTSFDEMMKSCVLNESQACSGPQIRMRVQPPPWKRTPLRLRRRN
jgi:hypothetical protein